MILARDNRIVFLFAGRVITLQSKKQTLVAQSTTEAEYYRMAKAVIEATWLSKFFSQISYTGDDTTTIRLCSDNQGSLSLIENP